MGPMGPMDRMGPMGQMGLKGRHTSPRGAQRKRARPRGSTQAQGCTHGGPNGGGHTRPREAHNPKGGTQAQGSQSPEATRWDGCLQTYLAGGGDFNKNCIEKGQEASRADSE